MFEYKALPAFTGTDVNDLLNREAAGGWRFIGHFHGKAIMERTVPNGCVPHSSLDQSHDIPITQKKRRGRPPKK